MPVTLSLPPEKLIYLPYFLFVLDKRGIYEKGLPGRGFVEPLRMGISQGDVGKHARPQFTD
jgi:hypothetical protein